MRIYYDFHIHTCLSPCADDDMTPGNIAGMAALCGLSAIGVTDHNSCANAAAVMEAGAAAGLVVLPGMELCTAEEIHTVCLFPDMEAAAVFDETVAKHLNGIENRPDIFGAQRLMTADDAPRGEFPLMLSGATSLSLDEVLPLARRCGGTAFPAHIDRPSYSVLAALGSLPPLGFCTVELSGNGDYDKLSVAHREIAGKLILRDSDAHSLAMMRDAGPYLELPDDLAGRTLAAAIVAMLDTGSSPAASYDPL